MKTVLRALGTLLAVAVGVRMAAELLAPVIPLLVVVTLLVYVLWIVVGRPGRL